MPAAAVIPAPIAYINVVAVKKLVVGCVGWRRADRALVPAPASPFPWDQVLGSCLFSSPKPPAFYFEEIRVFKAGAVRLNTLAWNNEIGLLFYFVGSLEPE